MFRHFVPLAGCLTLLTTVGTARAELPLSGAFDLIGCGAGHATAIVVDEQNSFWSEDDQITFYHTDPPGGPFDMTWSKCVGMGGKNPKEVFVDTMCQMFDKDGDTFIRRHRFTVDARTGAKQSNFEMYAGSGKYAGLKGQGKSERLVTYDTKTSGLYANCERYRGSYTLSR